LEAAVPNRLRALVAPLLLSLAIGGLVAYRLAQHAALPPLPPPPLASASVDLGVTTAPLARNSWRLWEPRDLASVDQFERVAGKRATVIMWYADWTHGAVSQRQLDVVAARGAIPEITWEPWDYTLGLRRPQPGYTLASIAAGAHDSVVRYWAHELAAYARPVRLRFAQEMNGNWYPWGETVNGNRPGDFVRAWRHVHDLFAAAGARNVKWVWSPVALQLHAEQYPGDAYVDIVGLTAFNGGVQLHYNHWRSFASKVAAPLAALHRIAPRKPVEISEVGSGETGGDKAAWIRGLFATLNRHREIATLIWYDLSKGSDWRVDSSRASARAFAAGLRNRRFR
jgi:hypothetical protein